MRILAKLMAVSVAVAVGAVVTAGPATAHVHVDEGQTPPAGGYGIVRLVVPTESDDESTVGVTVVLPDGVDLAIARTLPITGWTASVETEAVASGVRVTQISWRATDEANGIKPSEFGEFTFSAGPWPQNPGTVALLTDQTYSDRSVVSWNEIAIDKDSEPEYPAPLVTLSPPEAEHGDDGHGATRDPADALPVGTEHEPVSTDVAHAATPATGAESWFWRITSLAGLVIALGTAGLFALSLRRTRRTGSS